MSISMDLRCRVIKATREEGYTRREAAELFGVSIASVYRWLKKVEPEKPGPKAPHKINLLALKQDVEANPDSFHAERAERLGVKKSTIGRWMNILELTRKKNVGTPQSMYTKKG